MKRFLHFAVLSVTLSAATIIPCFGTQLPAKSAPVIVSQKVMFKPPDVDAPDNRQAGTHRGESCPKELSIIPLMPLSNTGLTVAESPTFFVYVSDSSVTVEFNLQEATDGTADRTADNTTEVYKTTFKVGKPGIVGVRIPAGTGNQKSLEVGKQYQWSFSVACKTDDTGDRSGDYYVTGSVQRVEPVASLKRDLLNAEPLARASAYAQNDIWYETVSTLAEMLHNAPEDKALAAEWEQLLRSQKLDSIATQPLVKPL